MNIFKTKIVEVDRDLTEIELGSRLAEKLGDIDSLNLTAEGVNQVFSDLSRVEGLLDFLRDTMVSDIRRYFAAQTEKERDIIRGGFSRTAYLKTEIMKMQQNI